MEKQLHYAFGDHRVPTNKEFFRIDPNRVKAALKLVEIREITPSSDPEITEEMREFAKRRPPFRFSLAKIPVGAELRFAKDENILCKVINDKEIEFEGRITSLSAAASEILSRSGRKAAPVQSPIYWIYEEESLEERRQRVQAQA